MDGPLSLAYKMQCATRMVHSAIFFSPTHFISGIPASIGLKFSFLRSPLKGDCCVKIVDRWLLNLASNLQKTPKSFIHYTFYTFLYVF